MLKLRDILATDTALYMIAKIDTIEDGYEYTLKLVTHIEARLPHPIVCYDELSFAYRQGRLNGPSLTSVLTGIQYWRIIIPFGILY